MLFSKFDFEKPILKILVESKKLNILNILIVVVVVDRTGTKSQGVSL